ncbi:LysE family translocator [Phreatobacter sp. AB_2022a]|uniref:LysE family translocator n=1 Tax=Phreatobacter sp. AB_2022a TaxID=3003134 RepID=UPI002286FFEC|nr:LysE family transporter [Phreatobacter sp. AB_2022a]MCZ0736577.1 LysE family transporter [Phreatobacter sp. AB_2022a]
MPIAADSVTILASVAVLWALAAVSPGPNFVLTAQLAVTRSRRDGLMAVGGIGFGTVIWGFAGCFGVQALFVAAPWLYAGLKLAGAAYLIGMGLRLIWQSLGPRGAAGEPADAAGGQISRRRSAFVLGLVTTIANPRSAVSVASIFATTMPAKPPLGLGVMVIAVMVAVSVAWYAIVALLFTLGGLAGAYRRGRRWVDRITGACFLAFGARLAMER